MAVVAIVVAPQRLPARYAKDWLRSPVFPDHLDFDHPSVDPLIGCDVESAVVRFDEAHLAVRPRIADALEVDELVALDGFPAALVLPVAYLHDDVHRCNPCPAAACP